MQKGADYSVLKKKLRLKYVLDKVLAAILLIVTFPVFIIVAFIIKIDGLRHPENSGSVFYTEPRMSEKKMFNIIKFRTITGSSIKWIREQPDTRSSTGNPNITAAGKFILEWYLDELPQIINILKGDMSFVGPRPHIKAQSLDELNNRGLSYRKYMRAGLMGVVQAWKSDPKYQTVFKKMARKHKSYNERINRLELHYASRCMKISVWEIVLYDAYLIIKCLGVVFRGKKKAVI
ncbi:MAG: sugar transferase [Candidatus Omnitrophota bacterium]|nr:sugar transferase [Candidatus Omnitrophota bacterium]